jgi:hypothetical protein
LENADLGFYALISKWGFPKTFRGKIMLVAFLGTPAPLLGVAVGGRVGSPARRAETMQDLGYELPRILLLRLSEKPPMRLWRSPKVRRKGTPRPISPPVHWPNPRSD